MVEFIIQLGILIVVASILGILVKFIKQPPLIGYIFSGLLLAYLSSANIIHFDITNNKEIMDTIGELGIILLLFIAGLEIKFKEFLKSAKTALIIGEGHDLVMGIIAFLMAHFLMGLSPLHSFYLAITLTLSSTIVVVKILEERKEVEAPHGRILLGTMLLQDLVALSALAIFTSIAEPGGSPATQIGLTIVKGIIVFAVLFFTGKYVMSKIFKKIAGKIELVFLAGLMWAFLGVLFSENVGVIFHAIGILPDKLGFSIEIGAFFAGMSIAHLPFSFEIKDKTRALQDFGLLLFFFTIGATAKFTKEILLAPSFWAIILFVVAATPIITGAIASFLAIEKKRNFLIGFMPIQVSEFSLVIATIGLRLGQINEALFTFITGVTIFTIIISSAILTNLNWVYRKIEDYLNILEWKVTIKDTVEKEIKDHIIILGMGPLGQHIAAHYRKKKKKVVVVEWLPDRIEAAQRLGCEITYGDAGDPDVWEEIHADKARMIISTIGNNQDDDVNLYNWVKKKNKRVYIISETNITEDAVEMRKMGFNHVLVQDEAEWTVLSKFLKKLKV